MHCISNSWTAAEWGSIISAITAVLAVLVGPWLQARIAKRQAADNIAAKRQNWIDELRSDSSEFLQILSTRASDLGLMRDAQAEQKQFDPWNELRAGLIRGAELIFRIKLRFNADEQLHNDFYRGLGMLDEASRDESVPTTVESEQEKLTKFMSLRDDAIGHLQTILKGEWERIKRGD